MIQYCSLSSLNQSDIYNIGTRTLLNQRQIQFWNKIEAMSILEQDCTFLGVQPVRFDVSSYISETLTLKLLFLIMCVSATFLRIRRYNYFIWF